MGNFKEYKGFDTISDFSNTIYVARNPNPDIFEKALKESGWYSIVAPRQCGKSSYSKYISHSLNIDQILVLPIDLRGPNPKGTSTSNTSAENKKNENIFYKDLYVKLRKISLLQEYENRDLSNLDGTDFFEMLSKELESKYLSFERVIIMIDEFDKIERWDLLKSDFIEQLVLLIDSNPKLSLLTMSICEPYLYHRDPYNYSTRITCGYLRDFTPSPDILEKWAEGLYNIEDSNFKSKICKLAFKYSNGHPNLTSRILGDFQKLTAKEISEFKLSDYERIITNKYIKKWNYMDLRAKCYSPIESILFHDNEKFHQILDYWEKILDDNNDNLCVIDDQSILNIFSMSGLSKYNNLSNNTITYRNLIYKRVFNKNWVKNLREQWVRKPNPNKLAINSSDINDEERKKFKVCIINTGGTIGMKEELGEFTAPRQGEINKMYPFISNICDFELISQEPKDGANMYPEDWIKISKLIYEYRHSGYCGFVVLHGTDTLPYTASAVAFALGKNLNFPVVFVGSQAPHKAYHGDASPNLTRALKIATLGGEKLHEVVVCFNDLIYRAVRVEKINDYLFKGFDSPTYPPLGIISERIEFNEKFIRQKRKNSADIKLVNQFEIGVLKICQTPGLQVNWYKNFIQAKKNSIKAIIIESLGLGNLPSRNNDNIDHQYEYITLIRKANRLGIPVVITSKYPIIVDFIHKYKPAQNVINAGGIWAGNLNSVSAQVKLMWLMPQILKKFKTNFDIKLVNQELMTRMLNDEIGEIDGTKKNY